MEEEVIISNPARASSRYPVTQEQIDDILENALTVERHKWIDSQISGFFKNMEDR